MVLVGRLADDRSVPTRRTLFALLLAAVPGFAQQQQQAKRAAKEARRRAKETRKLASRDVADRQVLGEERAAERRRLNASNNELDKARRQDHADLNNSRQMHIERTIIDTPPPAEEPKPGLKPTTRNVDAPQTPPKDK